MYLRILRRNTDYAIIIFGISILTEMGRECRGEIILPPSNKAVLEGQEVFMECQTNDSAQIVWKKLENSSTESTSVIIFTGAKIALKFSHIYGVNKTTEGKYDLSMNASMAIAGKYSCEEPGGKSVSAELIVLATNPTCFIKTQVGFNSTLECRLQLNGNWFPEMEWEEEYYNKTRNESHVIRITGNTVASNKLIVSTMTVSGEGFPRSFTCKTKFKSTGIPHSTTAKNVPNYEYKCIVSVSALQQSSTAAVYTKDDYLIPLLIGPVIMCVTLLLLICIFRKRKYRGPITTLMPRKLTPKNRNENATNEVQRHTECADVIKDVITNSGLITCTSDEGVEYMEMNGFREQPVELSSAHPSRYEKVIYAAIDHTNPPPKPPKAVG